MRRFGLPLATMTLLTMSLTGCLVPGGTSTPGGKASSEGSSGGSPLTSDAGTLDESFGTKGIVLTDVANGSNDIAYGLALQPDGKILAAGASVAFVIKDVSGTFALVRYLSNGSPDPAFGTQGRVITGQGSSAQARDVAVTKEGRIVTTGWRQNTVVDFLVSRHLPNGELDPEFGQEGHALGGFGEGYNRAIALQPDGMLLVAGYGGSYIDYDGLITRLDADGAPDPEFGTDGKVHIDWDTDDDQAQAIAVDNGKIYLGGSAKENGFALSRLQADGSLDMSFGQGGTVKVESDQAAKGLAVAPDGTIVMAGGTRVMRFTEAGEVDAAFGTDGAVDLAGQTLNAVAVQPDGKILVAGSRQGKVCLTRLKADGSVDEQFGAEGTALVAAANGAAEAHALELQPDGRIVLSGKAFRNQDKAGHEEFMLMRFWP